MALSPYQFRERGTAYPRHVIRYTDTMEAVRKNVANRDGDHEIVIEPGVKFAVRLDISAILEPNETIEQAVISCYGVTAGITYTTKHVDITAQLGGSQDSDSPGEIAVFIETTALLQFQTKIYVRPKRRKFSGQQHGFTQSRGVA